MCGIAGLWFPGGRASTGAERSLIRMLDRIQSRGPNARGILWDPQRIVGLGHQRLSILDLTPSGAQPMTDDSGRWSMVFNGEVYNHTEIRQLLAKDGRNPRWRGHSDTEVILEAIAHWGLSRAVRVFNGMFALAVWDRAEGSLSFVRDRAGVKPLFIARIPGGLAFASECRSLPDAEGFDPRLNVGALPFYLGFGYLPRGESIYADAVQLPPGTVLELGRGFNAATTWRDLRLAMGGRWVPRSSAGSCGTWRLASYWSAAEVWRRGQSSPFEGDFKAAVEETDRLVRDSVGLRMVADVPLGVFLSGGVDSSLVAAIMQRLSDRPVKTFTLGFKEKTHDESVFGSAIARHLGTEHTEHVVSEAESLEVAGGIGSLLDEPLGDSSFIPTYLVSRLTQRQVTVVLTGDGGDEGFGGYWRHAVLRRLAPWMRLPRPMRQAIGGACRLAGRWLLPGAAGHRLDRLSELISSVDLATAHVFFLTAPERAILASELEEEQRKLVALHREIKVRAPVPSFCCFDFLTVLAGDLLPKVDRATMRVALEAREPLLDYRLIEFAARLPEQYLHQSGIGKLPLRHALYRYVPRELIDRPKKGFSVPLAVWLRGPLRAWGEELLRNPPDLGPAVIDWSQVSRLWRDHQLGGRSHHAVLWNVLVLLAWLRERRWRI